MGRLVVVSNRVAPIVEGQPTSGGLAVGVLDALRESGGVWFGWNGKVVRRRTTRADQEQADGITYLTFGLSQKDINHYYNGYSNAALWPLFHSRIDLLEFERDDLAGYQRVNCYFAAKLLPHLKSNDLVWIHDYHLIPLGEHLRRRHPNLRIGFFLHTPFPSYDVLTALPGHADLVRQLCAYDVVGFHTDTYLRAFRDAVVQCVGGKIQRDGKISAAGRSLRADIFPIGVDTETITAQAATALRLGAVELLKESLSQRHLIIGVDRVDYTKGLLHRFESYSRFLARFPGHLGRISYLQISPPTRTGVTEYRDLNRRLSELAGDIVGRFSEPDWTPIRYVNRGFSRRILFGFYRLSRVGLVTPLRDGMNLVAKEYVAAQDPDNPGVLILSHLAGAAQELKTALLVNPYDRDEVAEALEHAVQMPLTERRRRWGAMMEVLHDNDVFAWRRNFVDALASVPINSS